MSAPTTAPPERATAVAPDGPDGDRADDTVDSGVRRVRLASLLGVGVGGVVFFLTLLDYGHDLLRGATAFNYASQFFELQATAIMDGHLDVPTGSLGIEGFVQDGRTYSYFGIFPALLRIPVMLITHEYDGRLTLLSMALAWVVYAVMATRLYWLVRERMGRPARPTGLETVLATLFLAAATGGTVLTFDASLPWVYHEVYLWSVASVIGTLYWLLRVLRSPDRSSVKWLFALALVAALTRTTGGWSVCLATIAAGLWFATGRLGRRDRKVWVSVVAAGLVPLLAGIAVNWLKFRHPYMFPLQNQVWTQLNAHRREVLAANGGTLASLHFFWSSFVNYFRPDGIRFVGYFPWVTLPGEAAPGYGAVLDQSSRTGSVPAFMPLLFLLTALSLPVLFLRRRASEGIRHLRLVWLGAFLMTGGVMAYGYIAYRYTSEFVPCLVVGGAVATVALGSWCSHRALALRVLLLGAVGGLTVFSLLANTAVGYSIAATTYKGPELESYLARQLSVSGSAPAWQKLVYASPGDPIGGKADELWIRGDCDALYFNTGEEGDPWVLVQERDTAVVVRTGPRIRPGTYPLMRTTAGEISVMRLEVGADRSARVVITRDGVRRSGQKFDLAPLAEVRIGARNLSELGVAEISSTPGGFVDYVPTAGWDDAQRPVLGHVELITQVPDPSSGVTVARADTLPLTLCRQIAAASGATLVPTD